MAGRQFKRHRYFKPYDKEFRVIKACRDLYREITRVVSRIPREYRFNIGKDTYELARSIYWDTRAANALELGSRERFETQMEVVRMADDLYDLFEPLEKLMLITPDKNAELSKTVTNLRFTYEWWLSSDLEQIRARKIEDKAADIRVQKTCFEE